MTTHTASGSDTITAGADTAKPLSSPKLPVTACLREQETKCGLGIECMIEAGAEREDGLMKLLWGAVVEVGSCAWGAGSSIHGRDKVSSEQNST